MTIHAVDERIIPPDEGWQPGCYLLGAGGEVLGRLPLGAYVQLQTWMRDPHSRPLRWIDYAGQHITTDRRAVRELVRRDMDACVVLEGDAQSPATWSDGDE